MINIAQVRSDTTGCEDVAHFNNAGSSLPPKQVVDAMVDYLRAEETGGGYEIAAARAGDLETVYGATARASARGVLLLDPNVAGPFSVWLVNESSN